MPTQMVAPSSEMSALLAPGTSICATLPAMCSNGCPPVVENTSRRFHGAIGDEKMLVCGVVDEVAMVGFAWRSVRCGRSVGTRVGGARETG